MTSSQKSLLILLGIADPYGGQFTTRKLVWSCRSYKRR